ncbi:MAG: hydroxyectoine utilization dehydratase EutB [Anaerolineaceae bacterium]|nr:hydroxyectoine utilization dehydratase EutB [Anaerolineaceae bacterium]MCB9100851.1 hydroxyectoine utilization dehydratase EutB [Anaerolineales bacterium]
MPTPLTLQDIFLAQKTIAPLARHTPLMPSLLLSERTGTAVYLKLELLQETGAFKVRGAANKILNLPAEARQRGVVTVSTGNHGRAVAYVAGQLGLNAAVCISKRVPQNKVQALRQLKAEVVIHGQSQDEAEVRARQIQDERGATLIPPFDDPLIIAGQGTIGLELLADLPAIDTALVPLSGGGLMAGIALALKSANPAIRVIGVSMERAAVMHRSLQAGRPVQLPEEPTLADSLQGGIGLDNQYTLAMVQQYVDDVILLTEAEIAAGMAFAFFEHHLVLEGAGAVGIAALLHHKVAPLGQHVAVVLSGGNVDLRSFLEVVQGERGD